MNTHATPHRTLRFARVRHGKSIPQIPTWTLAGSLDGFVVDLEMLLACADGTRFERQLQRAVEVVRELVRREHDERFCGGLGI